MKKYLVLFLLIITVRAKAQDYDKIFAESKIISETLKTLFAEANDGFKLRIGKNVSEANGVTRFATEPIAGLNTASQFISVKDGHAYYVMTFDGKKPFAYVDHAVFRLTNSFRDVDGPYDMQDAYIDVSNNAQKSLFHDDDALYNGTNDGWRTQTIKEKGTGRPLGRYRTMYKEKKAMLIIGPMVDYNIELDKKLAKQDADWRENTRKAYKMTGFAEQDSIGISHYGDINGDGGIGRAVEKLYELQANDDYGHTIGEEFKSADGVVRYRSPAWFNSDMAYYQKDTSGLGTLLYAYYKPGKPATMELLQALHRIYSANNYTVIGTAGPHQFLYFNRDGSTMMYRFDTTATSVFKGLTIIVMQMWKLKEKIAQYEAAERSNQAMERYRQNNNTSNTNKGQTAYALPCFCCHGTGKVKVKSNNTYMVKDNYGNNQGTTNYIDQNCPCCNGSGKQL